MNKYTQQIRQGKDAQVVVMEMYHEINDLRTQLSASANKSQLMIFKLENEIEALKKENEFLKRRNYGKNHK